MPKRWNRANLGGKPIEIKGVVGAAGFELATSRSQSERTTRLCYAPSISINQRIQVSNSKLPNTVGQVKPPENAVKTGLFVETLSPDG